MFVRNCLPLFGVWTLFFHPNPFLVESFRKGELIRQNEVMHLHCQYSLKQSETQVDWDCEDFKSVPTICYYVVDQTSVLDARSDEFGLKWTSVWKKVSFARQINSSHTVSLCFNVLEKNGRQSFAETGERWEMTTFCVFVNKTEFHDHNNCWFTFLTQQQLQRNSHDWSK